MFEAHCRQCGAVSAFGSRFCESCGASLAESEQKQPLAPPPPVASPPTRPEPVPPPYRPMPPSAPPPGGYRTAPRATPDQGRAIAALILGISGFIFCGPFTAIPGIIVGKMELNAIREGRSPQSNEAMAKAGFYISLGVTILYVVMFVLVLMFGLLPAILSNIK